MRIGEIHRLTRIPTPHPANQLANVYGANWAPKAGYTYDQSGNMTKRQSGPFGGSTNATYDELNRATVWEQRGSGDVP